jgi:hypothetical protein
MEKEIEITWCESGRVWRVWKNSNLLFCHFLFDKHRAVCNGVVMQQQPIITVPKLRIIMMK